MDNAHDIPDSTDWLNTPLSGLADLENALHCQICKEFYETPMTTSCSHTFCSRCIRTSLTADGKCPACRANDQASKLRNNWALEEVVATFLAARPAAITVARMEQEQAAQARRPGKRKRILDSDDIQHAEAEVRTTRSKSRRLAASQSSQAEPIEVEESDGDDDFEPEPKEQPHDGMVECPLGCGKRMKIEQVEPHLDRCEDEQKQEKRAKSRTPVNSFNSPRASTKAQERLGQLNYSMMRENAMRKKFEELGIPSWGIKQLLIRRHTEWVNLWNANCDSSQPRTKRELLHDLDTWERTQGGKAPNANGVATHSVMRKDFDGNAWASRNRDDFSRLIADARRKKSNPAMASNSPKDESKEQLAAEISTKEGAIPGVVAAVPSPNPPASAQRSTDEPEAITSRQQNEEPNPVSQAVEAKPSAAAHTSCGESHEIIASGHLSSSETAQAPAPLKNGLVDGKIDADDECDSAQKKSQHTASDGLPAQFLSSPRKMPMFTVPEQAMTDADRGGGHTAQ